MTKNIITDYLKVQLNRNYENKQAFYDLCDTWFKGSEYEGLLGLQLFVTQNMRMPNHMYGLNRVSYNAPSDSDGEIITVLTHEDLLIDTAFELMVRRHIYNHYADLFDDNDLFCEEGLMELADKL